MPQEHHLKIWPASFNAIVHGDKRAEFRRNERNFEVGDVLVLHEFLPETYTYTHRSQQVVVMDVQRGPAWEIPVGYAMLTIKVLKRGSDGRDEIPC